MANCRQKRDSHKTQMVYAVNSNLKEKVNMVMDSPGRHVDITEGVNTSWIAKHQFAVGFGGAALVTFLYLLYPMLRKLMDAEEAQ